MALQFSHRIIWDHITTVGFVSAFIFGSIRKPSDVYKHVLMGPKHNLANFKSLLWCLFIKSWSSFHPQCAGKKFMLTSSLHSHLGRHFRFFTELSHSPIQTSSRNVHDKNGALKPLWFYWGVTPVYTGITMHSVKNHWRNRICQRNRTLHYIILFSFWPLINFYSLIL